MGSADQGAQLGGRAPQGVRLSPAPHRHRSLGRILLVPTINGARHISVVIPAQAGMTEIDKPAASHASAIVGASPPRQFSRPDSSPIVILSHQRCGGDMQDGLPLQSLLHRQMACRPLTSEFYTSADVFAADLEFIHYRRWQFVAHACAVPTPGDYLTWTIGSHSIIVVRGQDGAVRAFHNVCRHRGSRICAEESGKVRRLVCPYHRWTYDLDGRLITAVEREFGVPREELGLKPVALRDVAGLLFISLAAAPPDFEPAARLLAPQLVRHGFAHAKVAHRIDYLVKANWKLVFENNRECYHCAAHHPEYVAATYDVQRDEAVVDPRRATEVDAVIDEAAKRFEAIGLGPAGLSSDMSGSYFRCNRTPLMAGFATESLDGKPVAPLMGDLPGFDTGTLRTTVFPNFWQHANADHAVAARLTPLAPDLTHVAGSWIVHKDAVEGRDYSLDRLLPVWDRTNRQDWALCEAQQQGASSPAYEPG
ncbi:MAG: aromatic ring-hydroxylating dioxygenase subunit alpha, partial [Hyphomicrobiaceae bacterium]